jgi:hypothetical protein
MEVSQSVQQTSFDQFNKIIKEKSSNKQEIIVQILEHQNFYTFSDFLQLPEIDEVRENLFRINHILIINLICLTCLYILAKSGRA